MSSPGKQTAEMSVPTLLQEFTEYSKKESQQRPSVLQQRVTALFSTFRAKALRADTPQQIGKLIAVIAKLVPIQNPLFSEFCDAVAALCIDREFVQFEDDDLATVFDTILRHLELRSLDPAPGLRALSTLLYNNTLRLPDFHERILDVALAVAAVSDESHRRCCVLLGNLTAFSKQQLEHQIYIKSWKFLVQEMAAATGNDLLSTALRALQLLILDAPPEVLDPQPLAQAVSAIAFRQGTCPLKYEAVMVLKALANCAKSAFYGQWPMLLTKTPSIFDLLRSNQKVAKASADLLTDIFKDTWKLLKVADNTSKGMAFGTLAQQIGFVVDVSFDRFLDILKDKLDPTLFHKTAKAFATLVRNCRFDSWRLKGDYFERVISWCKSVISVSPENSLLVLKSLLWTSIEFVPFASEFDYIFESFLAYLGDSSPDLSKLASAGLLRMASGYTSEVVKRYDLLSPKLQEVAPIESLPILLRLAENGLTDIKIWLDIMKLHIPKAYELTHERSIQRSLQCIGLCGPVFKEFPPDVQKFCISTVLASDYPEAAHAVGLLARSTAVDISPDFLQKALMKLLAFRPLELQPLSCVIEAYSEHSKDTFDPKWIESIMAVLNMSSPYSARCLGFLFCFIASDSAEASQCMTLLLSALKAGDPEVRWNAASALSRAFNRGISSDDAVKLLVQALDTDPVPEVKINSADALFSVGSRSQLGDLFHSLFNIVLQQVLVPVHFSHLPLATQRKYDSTFTVSLTRLFFKLLCWTTSRDFAAVGDALVSNVDAIYELMSGEEEAPWEQITRLYEAKFNSIPSKTLEKFQDRAFPV